MTGIDRRMFRYTIPIDDRAHVISLSGSPVACAASLGADGEFCVEFWAEHAETAPRARRAFQVFGTGHPLPDGATWAGTCPRVRGLVFHLYEIPSAELMPLFGQTGSPS
jgi:hypothetical protein